MGTLRITGGSLARRQIRIPSGAETRGLRPTSEKVRSAIFDILGTEVRGAHLIDAFAGSGALGLEAISRGAKSVSFIEKDKRFARNIEAALDTLGVRDRADVIAGEAHRVLSRAGPASVILLDPPYALKIDDTLASALAKELDDEGVIVIERSKRTVDELSWDLELDDERTYGDTRVRFYRRAPLARARKEGTASPA